MFSLLEVLYEHNMNTTEFVFEKKIVDDIEIYQYLKSCYKPASSDTIHEIANTLYSIIYNFNENKDLFVPQLNKLCKKIKNINQKMLKEDAEKYSDQFIEWYNYLVKIARKKTMVKLSVAKELNSSRTDIIEAAQTILNLSKVGGVRITVTGKVGFECMISWKDDDDHYFYSEEMKPNYHEQIANYLKAMEDDKI